MSAPSFWDDGRKAQILVQERAEMGRTVGTLNDLARDVGEVKLLWEMATEAGDESLTAEIEQGLKRSAAACLTPSMNQVATMRLWWSAGCPNTPRTGSAGRVMERVGSGSQEHCRSSLVEAFGRYFLP